MTENGCGGPAKRDHYSGLTSREREIQIRQDLDREIHDLERFGTQALFVSMLANLLLVILVITTILLLI